MNLGRGSLFPPAVNRMLQWNRLKRFLQERTAPFDLVHALWLDEPGGLALKAGAFLKAPVVASLGGGEAVWLPEIRYGGSGSVQNRSRIRRVLQSAQRITAGSRYALSLFRESRPDALWLPLLPETEPFIAKEQRDPAPPFRMLQVAEASSHSMSASVQQQPVHCFEASLNEYQPVSGT